MVSERTETGKLVVFDTIACLNVCWFRFVSVIQTELSISVVIRNPSGTARVKVTRLEVCSRREARQVELENSWKPASPVFSREYYVLFRDYADRMLFSRPESLFSVYRKRQQRGILFSFLFLFSPPLSFFLLVVVVGCRCLFFSFLSTRSMVELCVRPTHK